MKKKGKTNERFIPSNPKKQGEKKRFVLCQFENDLGIIDNKTYENKEQIKTVKWKEPFFRVKKTENKKDIGNDRKKKHSLGELCQKMWQ